MFRREPGFRCNETFRKEKDDTVNVSKGYQAPILRMIDSARDVMMMRSILFRIHSGVVFRSINFLVRFFLRGKESSTKDLWKTLEQQRRKGFDCDVRDTMTISYTLDVSQTNIQSFLKLLCRWRGSVWKAVTGQLLIWTATFLLISCVYRYVLTPDQQSCLSLCNGAALTVLL
ncbi:hypothetical protein DICVIV_01051 [Dictyocaulus viviparus]|uniref:Bestrophin homolog n=1 Tax=Dictyocaulus viviparus TaxID=29172 RepID=A0A0D8Y940_DICVI|nr:hypothetical protein DICVIV_01051 [Dictyocaulus viviparus]